MWGQLLLAWLGLLRSRGGLIVDPSFLGQRGALHGSVLVRGSRDHIHSLFFGQSTHIRSGLVRIAFGVVKKRVVQKLYGRGTADIGEGVRRRRAKSESVVALLLGGSASSSSSKSVGATLSTTSRWRVVFFFLFFVNFLDWLKLRLVGLHRVNTSEHEFVSFWPTNLEDTDVLGKNTLQYAVVNIHDVTTLNKRRLSSYHLNHTHSKGIDVYAGAIPWLVHFWRHKLWSAHNRGRCRGNKTQVSDFDRFSSRLYEDVVAFDITVDEATGLGGSGRSTVARGVGRLVF